jgi:hypothetical protein
MYWLSTSSLPRVCPPPKKCWRPGAEGSGPGGWPALTSQVSFFSTQENLDTYSAARRRRSRTICPPGMPLCRSGFSTEIPLTNNEFMHCCYNSVSNFLTCALLPQTSFRPGLREGRLHRRNHRQNYPVDAWVVHRPHRAHWRYLNQRLSAYQFLVHCYRSQTN